MSRQDDPRQLSTPILILSLAFFLALCWFSYPYYRFFIDPDATSYITIAKRYAAGDYTRAINGMWSPFSPWLVALFIKSSANPVTASHYANILACSAILISAFFLFRRFRIERVFGTVVMFALPFFLVYALYYQLFDDTWQLFFLLCYLQLLISKDFIRTWWKWLLAGLLGALAYFAKTYSFYFIVANLSVSVFFLCKTEGLPYRFAWKPLILSFITMLLVMSPWLTMLHGKYGKWAISVVGPIDISWSLTGHKTFKPHIKYLIPPSYPDSPGNMEDPWINEGKIYGLFDHPKFLVTEAGRAAHASVQFVKSLNEISAFLAVVLVVTTLVVFFKKDQHLFGRDHKLLLWASLILPLGYLAMHVEARFIWMLGFTGIVFASVWLRELRQTWLPGKAYIIMVLLFGFSYIAWPIYDLKLMFNKGKDIYEQSMAIKRLGLKGSFTSNDLPVRGPTTSFWTGMPYYTIEATHVPASELLKEMRRYQIDYYLFYHLPADEAEVIFRDEQGLPFPEVSGETIPGLKIFRIQP